MYDKEFQRKRREIAEEQLLKYSAVAMAQMDLEMITELQNDPTIPNPDPEKIANIWSRILETYNSRMHKKRRQEALLCASKIALIFAVILVLLLGITHLNHFGKR